jgi:CheY-like chemotaxis protein
VVEILLVEDNPADVQLFRSLLSGPHHITVAINGAEALDRLFQRGQFKDSQRPDLVVLDLNLPLLNGHEVLNAIKANSRLRSIPAIIFSVSDNPEDIQRAYDFGASAYIIKPSELRKMERLLSGFVEFWIRRVAYPGGARAKRRGTGGN